MQNKLFIKKSTQKFFSRYAQLNKRGTLKGFTLVELLIVVGIVGIIAAVSWGTLGGAKSKSDVLSACEQVAAMINKTRNYALSGRLPVGTVTASVTVSGNSVQITSPTPTETFTIPGGVMCTSNNATYSYDAPSAVGANTNNITCSSANGGSRTISVTSFQATCN